MRELHLRVEDEDHEAVTSVLEEYNIDHMTVGGQADGALLLAAVPTGLVSGLLKELREIGVVEESYTILTKVEVAETPRSAALYDKYSDSVPKLSREELQGKIYEIRWPSPIYYVGTILSVLAATAGLLLDQPALIIGSMIIAPQVSTALATPTGILTSDWEMTLDSIKQQTLGLASAIVGAVLFAVVVRWMQFVPTSLSVIQIELIGVRLSPTFLSTVGAVIAGIVGAFGFTTEQSTSLIGVMVAAALIPAAATAGIAAAWGLPVLAIGALLLLLGNLLAINLGALLTLIAMGYELQWRSEESSLRGSISSASGTALYMTLGIVAITFLVTGYLIATNVVYSQSINEEIQNTLEEPEYADLSLSGVRTEYGGALPEMEPTSVSVHLNRPQDGMYPDLGDRLERRIERRTGRDVVVTVTFTDASRSDESSPSLAEEGALSRNQGGHRSVNRRDHQDVWPGAPIDDRRRRPGPRSTVRFPTTPPLPVTP